MHLIILFTNIGSYHAARLRAAYQACQKRGWQFTALQITNDHLHHPWGDLSQEIDFPLETFVDTTASTYQAGHVPEVRPKDIDPILERLKPTVVALPGWSSPVARYMLRWSRKHKLTTVLMSESKWDDTRRHWWKEQLKSWLYVRHFDAALVGGELHRQYAYQLGIPLDRIFLGYDVVDNAHFEKGAAVARADNEAARFRQPDIPHKPYFICLTRFLARKNILNLIEAYRLYRNQIKPDHAWDLVVCGNGQQLKEIKATIKQNKLSACVHLPGFVPYQSLGDWYGLAEALIHPALQEQWGLVINEACAAGLPILCSTTVGARYELVKLDDNGLLFNPHRLPEITNALVQMHRIPHETRMVMGRRSQQRVAAFTPEQFAHGLVAAIETAMGRPTAHTLKTLEQL